jgi:hypothetical protein
VPGPAPCPGGRRPHRRLPRREDDRWTPLATYIVHGLGAASARPDGWIPLRLGALIAGAAAATALLRTAPAWAGVLPVVLVPAALLIACLPFLATRPQWAARAG